jgi:CIC family chloride channel protein
LLDGEAPQDTDPTPAPDRPDEAPAPVLVNSRYAPGHDRLADFTTTPRLLLLCAMALVVGAISAVVAYCLYWLIGAITNLSFYLRLSSRFTSPAANRLGGWEVLVPVVGGLIIGLMARYGSERIRGHGIPEALESILIGGSRVEPRLAVFKPISAAVSIGTGGPFGAEGPIIMTGGAFGSLFAQFFRLSAAERKTLLVAGAAAGMSATFATPVSATLIAVELLLFEWKPRSLIPVALASAVAAVLRVPLIGPGPLFPVPLHGPQPWQALVVCLALGIVGGGFSAVLTALVYFFEDRFMALRHLHWMWWPAVGGLVIGAGGLVEPRALGVGYDTIHALLAGQVPGGLAAGLLTVKALIWSFALGSGTSGGVVAPLLMMGAGIGAIVAPLIPLGNVSLWAMVGMSAMLGGVMRVPFTAALFTLELTHDWNLLLPLLVTCMAAYGTTVLLMRRSILTEKVARRGHHLTREYVVDPLEMLRVAEIMTPKVEALPGDMPLSAAVAVLTAERGPGQRRRHEAYPIIDAAGRVLGIATHTDGLEWASSDLAGDGRLADRLTGKPVVAHPDEPSARAAARMAERKMICIPVAARDDGKLIGIVSRGDLLAGRLRQLLEETDRRRIFLNGNGGAGRWRQRAAPEAGGNGLGEPEA